MKLSWSVKHVDNMQGKSASESLPMGVEPRVLEDRELDAVVGGQSSSASLANGTTNGGVTHTD
ncbi:hypothetical protein D187_001328 [Cystobacter fuscus DSM 2262]|uniref:Uncharacterized protein n=1 Tax=Cystobacter fuscus (strain ATCC 25194 / DSM 2262 / NBRC 100088 / M29) TaxID=1242864 RepID=S9QHD4_CYSF2|nr:hypothetical protein [Cystobacter fuscus]EPX60679.1 hypothetical protein D187_001328 [Cystobacter fuscus DSM 2262]